MAEAPAIVQVTNVSPTATLEQMRTLFSHVGLLDDLVIYPSDGIEEPASKVCDFVYNSKVCYVRYNDPVNAEVALYLNNTVFLDRALIVLPLENRDSEFPDEKTANLVRCPANTYAGVVPRTADWPLDVVSMVVGRPGEQVIQTSDPRLTSLALPTYPPLPATTDCNKIEEIRRTILVTNLDPKTTGDQVLDFFNKSSEVRCVRMAGTELDRAAYVEFTHQTSVPKAFSSMGATLNGRQVCLTGGRYRSRSRSSHHRRSRSRSRGSRHNYSRDRRRSRSRHRRRRSGSRSRPRGHRSRSRSYGRHRSRSRSYERRRDRERSRSRQRRRHRSRSRSERRRRSDSRSKNRRSERHGRESDREHRDRDKVRHRDRSRDRKRERSRSRKTHKDSKHESNSNGTESVLKESELDNSTSEIPVPDNSISNDIKSSHDSSSSNSSPAPVSANGDQADSLADNSPVEKQDTPDQSTNKPTIVGVKLAGPEDDMPGPSSTVESDDAMDIVA